MANDTQTCDWAAQDEAGLLPLDGRYVVLCDDGSLIATDELMDGDDVVLDRGEDE